MATYRNPKRPSELITGVKFRCGKPQKVTPSTKRELRRVQKENRLSDLMDCKVVDKYFDGEHKFTPTKPQVYLPSMSYEKVALYMQEGASYIESKSCFRTLYRFDKPFASLDNSTLNKLVNAGIIKCVTPADALVARFELA